MISRVKFISRRAGAILLAGTALGGSATPLLAQTAPAGTEAPSGRDCMRWLRHRRPCLLPVIHTIRSIAVRGNQRLEPETIRSYANLSPGQTYTAETLDQALKDLYATQLFADVNIAGTETGDLVINVRENPVINRIILEGNKRLKEDKITPEIKLAPRQIFTRSAARADVDRILELYRRQGRFAARVEPKIVQLDQNRVDVVFEIYEGGLAKVRAINIIGNKEFPDGRLRKEMYTRQAGGVLGFLKSNDTYDPGPARRRPAEASRFLPDRRVMPTSASSPRSPNSRPTGRTSSSPTWSRRAALQIRQDRRRKCAARLPACDDQAER